MRSICRNWAAFPPHSPSAVSRRIVAAYSHILSYLFHPINLRTLCSQISLERMENPDHSVSLLCVCCLLAETPVAHNKRCAAWRSVLVIPGCVHPAADVGRALHELHLESGAATAIPRVVIPTARDTTTAVGLGLIARSSLDCYSLAHHAATVVRASDRSRALCALICGY